MKNADDIKELFEKSNVEVNLTKDLEIQQKVLSLYEKHKPAQPVQIWRIIMKSPIAKLAVAALIIIAAVIGIGSLESSSIAFGDVLKKIHGSSYTFDLTMSEAGSSNIAKAMVFGPGKVRIDAEGQINVSTILDVQTSKSLILFHQQKIGRIFDKGDFGAVTNPEAGLAGLFIRPIENLWNLRDGTEKEIGDKQIDGRKAKGFQVFQEDELCKYEINVWADAKTAEPIEVDVKMMPKDGSSESATFVLDNFKLGVKLDEKLFSLEVPDGYTLGYQKEINQIDTGNVTSEEAKKIGELLELWVLGEKEKAIELCMNIDWSKQFAFSGKPYIFAITEKGYISLKQDIQQQVMNEILTSSTTLRVITNEIISRGKQSMANKDYQKAEKYFSASFQLGKLLTANPDLVLVSRLVGIAIKKRALDEMIKLYTETKNADKLSAAHQEMKLAQEESDKIKKFAGGQ